MNTAQCIFHNSLQTKKVAVKIVAQLWTYDRCHGDLLSIQSIYSCLSGEMGRDSNYECNIKITLYQQHSGDCKTKNKSNTVAIVIKKTATVIYQRLQNTNSSTTAIVFIQNTNTQQQLTILKPRIIYSITAMQQKHQQLVQKSTRCYSNISFYIIEL